MYNKFKEDVKRNNVFNISFGKLREGLEENDLIKQSYLNAIDVMIERLNNYEFTLEKCALVTRKFAEIELRHLQEQRKLIQDHE